MIEFQKEPYKDEEIYQVLNPIVKTWFKSKFKEFALPQTYITEKIPLFQLSQALERHLLHSCLY